MRLKSQAAFPARESVPWKSGRSWNSKACQRNNQKRRSKEYATSKNSRVIRRRYAKDHHFFMVQRQRRRGGELLYLDLQGFEDHQHRSLRRFWTRSKRISDDR